METRIFIWETDFRREYFTQVRIVLEAKGWGMGARILIMDLQCVVVFCIAIFVRSAVVARKYYYNYYYDY